MKLEIKDRLILSNQFKILEQLYPEEKEYFSQNRKAIEEGYELHYAWMTQGFNDPLPVDECIYVLNVLQMFEEIYKSFKLIGKSDKIAEKRVIFPGFDGNGEAAYMTYTSYIVDDLQRFDTIRKIKNGYYNSHTPMVGKYKDMLSKKNGYKFPYNENQLLSLLIDL